MIRIGYPDAWTLKPKLNSGSNRPYFILFLSLIPYNSHHSIILARPLASPCPRWTQR